MASSTIVISRARLIPLAALAVAAGNTPTTHAGQDTPLLDTAELRLEAAGYPGSGDWQDLSGNDHHGVISGAAWLIDEEGRPYFEFDGNDMIVVPDHAGLDFGSSDSFTALVVARLPAGENEWDRLIDKRGAGQNPGYAMIMSASSKVVAAEVYDQGGGGTWLSTGDPMDNDELQVYTLRREAGGPTTLLRNGEVTASTGNGLGSLSNSMDLHIGVHANGSWNTLTGSIYAVVIFRDALSMAEINAVTAELLGPVAQYASFTDVTDDVGLGVYIAQTGDGPRPGAVFADLDNDGWPDLYLMRAWGNPNLLYLNVDGGGGRVFEQASGNAGAGDPGNATGAIAGDYDNDGDLDIFVTNFDQPNVLLQNRLIETGSLSFIDVTGSTDPTPGTSDDQYGVGIAWYEGIPLDNSLTAAWGDVDRDGDLDLYVGNHNGYYLNPVEGPYSSIPGRRDVFYLNNGDGTFSDVTMSTGLTGFELPGGGFQTANQRFSSTNAVIFADLNNDRWPDLFVTNKVGGPDDRDMIYVNRGDDGNGTWLGYDLVSYDLSEEFFYSGGAMGVDVADYDLDGDLDVYITDWSDLDEPFSPGSNDLWTNQLSETGQLDFVHSLTFRAQFSWGAQFQDFDNDGRQDLHIAVQAPQRDYLYMNPKQSIREQAQVAGVAQTGNGRGDVSADYNRDGWVDFFVVNLGNAPSVFWENRTADLAPSHRYLSLKLLGDPDTLVTHRSTRDAIGARVRLVADVDGNGDVAPDEVQLREVVSGSSNATSTSSLELEFGLGSTSTADVEILWPSGRDSVFRLAADRFIVIDEAELTPGDMNGDGVVNVTDLVGIITGWGPCPPSPQLCPADIDGNGEVNVNDLLAVILGWG